jgi:hypothetical protein
MRVMLGLLLIGAGVDKFKSSDPPYSYSWTNWMDQYNSEGKVEKAGKWRNIAKAVFVNGGFDNEAVYGRKGVNFISHCFKAYACVLPFAMLAVGICILIGFCNVLSLFLGAGIWLSLAAGQMTLPDNYYVWLLSTYTLLYVVALTLVKHNRFALTRF